MVIKSKSAKKISLLIFIFCNAIFAVIYIPVILIQPSAALNASILFIFGLLFGLIFSSIYFFLRRDQLEINQEDLIYKNLFVNKKVKINDIKSVKLRTPIYLNPFENVFGSSPYSRLVFEDSSSKLSIDYRSFDKSKMTDLLKQIKDNNKDVSMDDSVQNLLK